MSIKVVFVGNASVGKTSLITRIVTGEFNQYQVSTTGVAMQNYIYESESKTYEYQIWDTAGQEQYRALTPNYVRNAVFAVLVYSVNDRSSFEGLSDWVKLIKDQDPSIHLIVVANKCDITEGRAVSLEEGVGFSTNIGAVTHLECSALTGYSVFMIFDTISGIPVKVVDKESGTIQIKANKESDPWKPKKKCC